MSLAPKLLQKLEHHHTSDVSSVDFHGSMLITASSDKTVRLFRWILGTGFAEVEHSPFIGHKYAVTKAQFSPKGSIAASSSVDGSVIFWDVNTGEKIDIIYQPNGEAIRCCIFSPDGNFIATSDDSGLVCIFGQDKCLKKSLKGIHEESVPTLAFSKDSKILLSACTLGNIRIFFSEFDAEIIEPDTLIDNAHDMGVLSADFCKVTKRDPIDPNTVIYTLATSGNDNQIKLWRIFCVMDAQQSRRNSNAGPSDGSSTYSRLIPTRLNEHFSGTSSIFPTQFMNAECINSFIAHGSSVTCVKFFQTGSNLASGGLDRIIKIWDFHGNCIKTLAEHSRYINCIAVNNDTTLLASGSNDKTVQIWDLTGTLTLNTNISSAIKSLCSAVLNANRVDVPHDFICPISLELMSDPVILEDGFTYERSAILEWFEKAKDGIIRSPMTNIEMGSMDVIDNVKLKADIENYIKKLDFDPFE